jgi:hypothetical protein
MGSCTSSPNRPSLFRGASASSHKSGSTSGNVPPLPSSTFGLQPVPPLIRKSSRVITPFGSGVIMDEQRDDGIWIIKLTWGATVYLGNPRDLRPFYSVYAVDCTHHQTGLLVAATMKILWRLVIVDNNQVWNPSPPVYEILLVHDVVTDEIIVKIGAETKNVQFSPIPIPKTLETRIDIGQYIIQLRVETAPSSFKYDLLVSGTPFGLLPHVTEVPKHTSGGSKSS